MPIFRQQRLFPSRFLFPTQTLPFVKRLHISARRREPSPIFSSLAQQWHTHTVSPALRLSSDYPKSKQPPRFL